MYPKQRDFLDATEFQTGFCGGRGVGKSYMGAYKFIKQLEPGRRYLMAAQTYRHMHDSTIISFKEMCDKLHISYKFHGKTETFSVKGATILCRSADAYERWRGPNLSGAWIDEASYVPEEAKKVLIGTLRQGGKVGWLILTFTPKGRAHWTYKLFFTPKGRCKKNTKLVTARTDENFYLPDGFEELIRADYSKRMAQQELEGIFLGALGSMYDERWFAERMIDYCDLPLQVRNVRRVRYWDKAATKDGGCYTAGVRLAALELDNGMVRYIVEDVIRGQWSSKEREDEILRTAFGDRDECLIEPEIWIEEEPGGSGVESAENTIQNLSDHGFSCQAEKVDKEKRVRAEPASAAAEKGNLWIANAPAWNDDFISEICGFPDGDFNDQFDSLSGAYNKLWRGYSPATLHGVRGYTAPDRGGMHAR